MTNIPTVRAIELLSATAAIQHIPAIHRFDTSLRVLFETFRQILDEFARIRSNSYPSVEQQNGVVSGYSHEDLHVVTLKAIYLEKTWHRTMADFHHIHMREVS